MTDRRLARRGRRCAARLTAATAIVALLAAGARGAAEPAAAEAPILGLAEVQAGQRGHGLSVFAGSVPTPFEVEILGVLRGPQAGGSYILARLSGSDLEKTGVIAGMSGSPVYVDGRLAGAVAFAWPFAEEPIAGITPIEQMRDIERRAAPALRPAASAVRLADLVERRVPATRLDDTLAEFARSVTGEHRDGMLWGAAGISAAARAALGRWLPSLAPLGEGETAAPGPELVAGSAVAALLIDGDLRLAATGTVTERRGDRLLAFGHSLAGLGDTEVPLAGAEIVTVLSSALSSFKLSNSGAVVGTLGRDHPYGVVGELGRMPRTVPLDLRVLAPATRDFKMRLADVPALLPTLAAISSLSAWDVTVGVGGVRGVDLALDVEFVGRPPLRLEQSFDGALASQEAVAYFSALLAYLAQNDLGTLRIARLEATAALHPAQRLATLVGVRPSAPVVAPGGTVELQVDLLGYDGEPLRWREPVVLPAELPEGRYSLLVGDGVSVDAARLGLAPAPPARLDQVLALLGSLHSAADLAIVGFFPSPGLTRAGELLPRLPPSLRSIWGASGARTALPLKNAVVQNLSTRRDRPLSGLLRVDLEVRRERTGEP